MIDVILGDLREEFGLLCEERGVFAARLWYIRQLLLSLPQMLKPADAWRALSIAASLMLLDRLWCFIYSLIPMKDGLDRAPGFLAANIVCACFCAAIFRPPALWAILSTALALSLAISAEPPLYICLTLFFVPATSLMTVRLREVR